MTKKGTFYPTPVLKSMALKENRRFPRYYAPESLVAVATFPGERQHQLHVVDISIDGLSCTTKFNISRESVFNISFDLIVADNPPVHIDTPAKINWFTFDKKSSLYTVGAQFLGLRDAQKQALLRALILLPPKST
jgi:c-di-GMP-binding flagellar brake protein YcgR